MRDLIAEQPWWDAKLGEDGGWRLARFYRSDRGVFSLHRGGRADRPLIIDSRALPSDQQRIAAEIAYARFCWRFGKDPLHRIPLTAPERRQRTRKRSWIVMCTQVGNAIRVSGARRTSRGKTTTRMMPGCEFSPELRQMLELKGNYLTGWSQIWELVYDLKKFGHPDLKFVADHMRAHKAWLRVSVPETEEYFVHPDGPDPVRRLKLSAGRRVRQLQEAARAST